MSCLNINGTCDIADNPTAIYSSDNSKLVRALSALASILSGSLSHTRLHDARKMSNDEYNAVRLAEINTITIEIWFRTVWTIRQIAYILIYN
jgi:hypothetical protein